MFLSHFEIKCNFKMKRKDLIEIYVYCNRFKIIVDWVLRDFIVNSWIFFAKVNKFLMQKFLLQLMRNFFFVYIF